MRSLLLEGLCQRAARQSGGFGGGLPTVSDRTGCANPPAGRARLRHRIASQRLTEVRQGADGHFPRSGPTEARPWDTWQNWARNTARGIPEHIRSNNGPEFIAGELRKGLEKVGTGTLYIEPGSPWENGYCESFNGKLRDEFLKGEISTR